MSLAEAHERNPDCTWCGKPTILWRRVPGERPPKNAATKDHLIMRRHRCKGESRIWVLACERCNHYRSLMQANSLKPEDSQQRARRRTQLLHDWLKEFDSRSTVESVRKCEEPGSAAGGPPINWRQGV